MQRLVRGDPKTISIARNSADTFPAGTMMVLVSGAARPASTQTTGATAASIFLGVAMEAVETSGSTAEISVATAGEFLFNANGTLSVGDRVKPHTSGGAALNDTVAASATGEYTIGRVVEVLGSRVVVRIFSILDRQHQAAAS